MALHTPPIDSRKRREPHQHYPPAHEPPAYHIKQIIPDLFGRCGEQKRRYPGYNQGEMAEIRHSVCALDCPDCCSVLVTVENGRATKLRGNPDHPVTRGFLCGKVAQYLEREYHPGRLLHPQRRTGAKGESRFEHISWDDALDMIAGRLHAIAREF